MPFTVPELPDLPADFASTFESRLVPLDGVTIHAVTGGSGPAILLLPGWPQFWYTWRLVMPELAKHFTVVAADLRGMGASDKPGVGYDFATMAGDMAKLMSALGHDRFSVVGYDFGMVVAYGLAATERDRVDRLIVAEAPLPGITTMFGFLPNDLNERFWHLSFNRLSTINEQLVRGREDIFFGDQLTTKAGKIDALEESAIELYIESMRDPAALHASFQYYRDAFSIGAEQNQRWRDDCPLEIPVLALGAELAMGTLPVDTMREVATDVTGHVLAGVGHFLPEEAPEELGGLIIDFLRD